jgi:hypothetical protein
MLTQIQLTWVNQIGLIGVGADLLLMPELIPSKALQR